jgi:hypothetical protein
MAGLVNNPDRFLPLDQVKLRLETLKQIRWPSFLPQDDPSSYVEKITEVFTTELNGIPDIVELLKPSDFGFKIFRARELSSFNDINLFAEHSYPPSNLSQLNRCNFRRFPVFYGSDHAMTALAEVVKDRDFKDKRYCISRWKLHATSEDILVQPYLFGDLHEDNPFRTLQQILNAKVDEIFQSLTPSQREGIRLYMKFMAELFVQDNYGVSASFAHRRLYAPHNLRTELLIYPSIQSLYRGVNFAIHPNLVDAKIYPLRFYIVNVEDFDKSSGAINVSFSSYGVLERSHVIWKSVTPDDQVYRDVIKEDFDLAGDLKFVPVTPN